MPQRIDLRNSIQLAQLGQQPSDVIAAIRRGHGGPDSGPCDVARHDSVVEAGNPADIFPTVRRLLGSNGFRQLWSDFRRSRRDPALPPRGFGTYLAANRRNVLRLGQDLPMLSDVARLDFAIHLARRPAQTPAIASLPEDLIRQHPQLMLRLQPGWLYLSLNWPVQRLLQDSRPQNLRRMIQAREQGSEGDRVLNLLRLSASPAPPTSGPATSAPATSAPATPGPATPDGVLVEELSRAAFTFESALAAGQSFTIAELAARQHDTGFDGSLALRRLIAAGGVTELLLTPPADDNQTNACEETAPTARRGTAHDNGPDASTRGQHDTQS